MSADAPVQLKPEKWRISLCITLVVIVSSIAIMFILFFLFVYLRKINKLYHRRLVPKGQHHEVEEKLEPIHYGFGTNKPHHPTEGALVRAVRGPSLEVLPRQQVARKSSTLEFPGLPTPIHMEDHERE